MPFFENNVHAAVTQEIIFWVALKLKTTKACCICMVHCIHMCYKCLLFLAQTSSNNVQEIIEGKVEKRTKG